MIFLVGIAVGFGLSWCYNHKDKVSAALHAIGNKLHKN
jgi:hypothetical protein